MDTYNDKLQEYIRKNQAHSNHIVQDVSTRSGIYQQKILVSFANIASLESALLHILDTLSVGRRIFFFHYRCHNSIHCKQVTSRGAFREDHICIVPSNEKEKFEIGVRRIFGDGFLVERDNDIIDLFVHIQTELSWAICSLRPCSHLMAMMTPMPIEDNDDTELDEAQHMCILATVEANVSIAEQLRSDTDMENLVEGAKISCQLVNMLHQCYLSTSMHSRIVHVFINYLHDMRSDELAVFVNSSMPPAADGASEESKHQYEQHGQCSRFRLCLVTELLFVALHESFLSTNASLRSLVCHISLGVPHFASSMHQLRQDIDRLPEDQRYVFGALRAALIVLTPVCWS